MKAGDLYKVRTVDPWPVEVVLIAGSERRETRKLHELTQNAQVMVLDISPVHLPSIPDLWIRCLTEFGPAFIKKDCLNVI